MLGKLEWEIAFVVEKMFIRLQIFLMGAVKKRGLVKLKKAILVPMIQKGTNFMFSALGVSKRNLPMWSPICYKYSLLIFMLYLSPVILSFITPLVAKKFDVLPNILSEPFSVTNKGCDSVVARRVFRSFYIFSQ